jgi:hypothetical protein
LAFPAKYFQLSISEGCRPLLDSYPSSLLSAICSEMNQNFQLVEHCSPELAFDARGYYWPNILDARRSTLPCLGYVFLIFSMEDEERDHDCDRECNDADDAPHRSPIAAGARPDGD